MKISGAIIQNRFIQANTESHFRATYKGKLINITNDHGHGPPEYEYLTRYDIMVIDNKTGMKDVDTYEDFHVMEDAIRYALKGARILK